VVVSGYGDARSLASMAERVLNDAPATFSLAGHSMGARVALEMFRLAPERIERLALLDTGVHPPGAEEPAKRMALLEKGKNDGMEALVDAWLPPMVHPDRRSDAAFMKPLRDMAVNAGIEQFGNQVAGLLGRPDATPLLSDVKCPVLVGVGRQDEWSPLEQHVAIAEMIDDAVLVVFEESGHMAPFEVPEQVSNALHAWMTTSASQPS